MAVIERYCSQDDHIATSPVDRAKLKETLDKFKEERGKIAGPIVERKAMPAQKVEEEEIKTASP